MTLSLLVCPMGIIIIPFAEVCYLDTGQTVNTLSDYCSGILASFESGLRINQTSLLIIS